MIKNIFLSFLNESMMTGGQMWNGSPAEIVGSRKE